VYDPYPEDSTDKPARNQAAGPIRQVSHPLRSDTILNYGESMSKGLVLIAALLPACARVSGGTEHTVGGEAVIQSRD
jgi:hypothetical protein